MLDASGIVRRGRQGEVGDMVAAVGGVGLV